MTYSWSLFWIWKQHTGARAMRSCVHRGAPVRKPARGILQKHSHECSSDSPRPALQAKYGSADHHGQGECSLTPYVQLYKQSYISYSAFVHLRQILTSANSGMPRRHRSTQIAFRLHYVYILWTDTKQNASGAPTVCSCAMSTNKSSHIHCWSHQASSK